MSGLWLRRCVCLVLGEALLQEAGPSRHKERDQDRTAPGGSILDLEAALRGIAVTVREAEIELFFHEHLLGRCDRPADISGNCGKLDGSRRFSQDFLFRAESHQLPGLNNTDHVNGG